MKKIIGMTAMMATSLSAQIVYEGLEGAGKGKHLVFIVSDHEYRSEQTCPALARILAKHHGFKCTVLFGVDEDGFIKAGASNIKGLEVLKQADGVVMFARFLNLPDEQMKHVVEYVGRGGPIVGLRTSSHSFKIPAGSTYEKFDYKYQGENYEKGFGHQVLGNTWVGHYGQNHKQGTRIQLEESQKNHPILEGVKDNAFCHAGAYVGVVRDDMTVLTKSQPLMSMEADAEVDIEKPPVASSWTRQYTGGNGEKGRVFHSTQGASEDILDASYRRLLINGIFWSVGLEKQIKKSNNVSFVGPYHPTTFKFKGEVKQQKPEDMAGFETVIGKKAE